MKKNEKLPNIHPGEVLLEEFLKPMSLSQNALARAIGVPPRRIMDMMIAAHAKSLNAVLVSNNQKHFNG